MNSYLLFLGSIFVSLIRGSGDAWDWDAYEYCSGDTQSPRAIISSELSSGSDVCTPHLNWMVKHHKKWKIKNTGHTIKLTPYNTTEKIGLLPNQFNPIHDVNGLYCFDSLHFHWASANDFGSEHTIDGKRWELEMHFVHYSCDYDNISHALHPSLNHIDIPDPYTLGVIGVMADNTAEHDNQAWNKILAEIPKIQYPPGVMNGVPGESIIEDFDITTIIPQDRNQFYYYEGSLTTPPCNPIVRWHVLKNGIELSNKQLNIIRTAMTDNFVPQYNNYREIQDNVNPVYECLYTTHDDSSSSHDDSHSSGNNNSTRTIIAMAIVGCIAMVAIIAVIIEFRASERQKRVRANTVQSMSHISGGNHAYSLNAHGLEHNMTATSHV